MDSVGDPVLEENWEDDSVIDCDEVMLMLCERDKACVELRVGC